MSYRCLHATQKEFVRGGFYHGKSVGAGSCKLDATKRQRQKLREK
jgi:hypothetical protein